MILKLQHTVLVAFVVLIGLLSSCQKSDDSDLTATGFIKTHHSEVELIGRGSFELPNKDIILFGCSYELPEQTAVFGTNKSEIACFSGEGETKWSQQVPDEIHALWDAALFSDGTMVLVGFDSLRQSPNLGLVRMSEQGEVLDKKVIVNPIGWVPNQASGFDPNKLSATRLNDGTVLLCLGSLGLGGYFMRLILIDSNLNVLADQTFDGNPGNSPLRIRAGNAFISETVEGNILVTYSIETFDGLDGKFSELSLPDFDEVNQVDFFEPGEGVIGQNSFIKSGDRIIVSSTNGDNDGAVGIRNMEWYSTNTNTSILTFQNENVSSRILSDIPANSYLSKFERTSDGGFIGIGNCDLLDPVLSSSSKIVLVKFSFSGDPEWTKVIDSGQMLIGQSITENSSGYLIAATSYSLDNFLQMVLIQTDKIGNY